MTAELPERYQKRVDFSGMLEYTQDMDEMSRCPLCGVEVEYWGRPGLAAWLAVDVLDILCSGSEDGVHAAPVERISKTD